MADQGLDKKIRTVISVQLLITAVIAVGFYFFKTPWDAVSSLYGSSIAMILAWWLSRGVSSAAQHNRGVAVLYISAALRFLMVLVLFGIGLGAIKLSPLATVIGFVLTQLGFAASASKR